MGMIGNIFEIVDGTITNKRSELAIRERELNIIEETMEAKKQEKLEAEQEEERRRIQEKEERDQEEQARIWRQEQEWRERAQEEERSQLYDEYLGIVEDGEDGDYEDFEEYFQAHHEEWEEEWEGEGLSETGWLFVLLFFLTIIAGIAGVLYYLYTQVQAFFSQQSAL